MKNTLPPDATAPAAEGRDLLTDAPVFEAPDPVASGTSVRGVARLSEQQVTSRRSRFSLEPLELGLGYPLGGALRRTLLSSVPGAAVTSVRISGVLHEFSTVPGVKEDVTDLLLNLKGLVVSSTSEEPVVLHLRKQGPATVTAADIVAPTGVEVHNPELHLATLSSKGSLEIELTVERGRGYVSSVQNKQDGQEIGRIPLDSLYSPVAKVSINVQTTHSAGTESDRLVLDVQTKPGTTPRDALASAGATLVAFTGLFAHANPADGSEPSSGDLPAYDTSGDVRALLVEQLDVSVRTKNLLQRAGITVVADLLTQAASDLRDIRTFADKALDEVTTALAGLGLSLQPERPRHA